MERVNLLSYVKIKANTVFNKSTYEVNILLTGQEVNIKKHTNSLWMEDYNGSNGTWMTRIKLIEVLRTTMHIL